MKIVSTAIILLFTLLVVPVITYFFGTALGAREWEVLSLLMIITGAIIAVTFLVGEITNNNSQVDKLWSIAPIAYVWIVAHHGDYSARLVLMAILVSLWGIRLTANFAMKGAYQWKFWGGEEDYRWLVLRQKPEFKPRWKWTLFNLFFICGYQNTLILLFTLPTLVALQYNDTPLGTLDIIIAVFVLAFILFEMIADIQHWNFQSAKWKKIKAGEPLEGDHKKGFLDKGLWSLSRHPNYFAEQAIWICFFFFSVAASGQWFNWSITGCLLLIVLFLGSSNFSEDISSSKYPGYLLYKKRVPRFIPIGRKIFAEHSKEEDQEKESRFPAS
jgi:steroid 5-alpha reductase family enzyme